LKFTIERASEIGEENKFIKEFNSIEELMIFIKDTGFSVLISDDGVITIYDDWLE